MRKGSLITRIEKLEKELIGNEEHTTLASLFGAIMTKGAHSRLEIKGRLRKLFEHKREA